MFVGLAMQCSAHSDWSPPAPPSPPTGYPPANSPHYFRGNSPACSPAYSPAYTPPPEYGFFGAPGPAPEGYPVPAQTAGAPAPEGYPVVAPAYAPLRGM